jgi:hypothetical protein
METIMRNWCQGDKIVMEARYHFGVDDDDLRPDEEQKFFAGDLYVDKQIVEFLSKILQLRTTFVLNVITEWYDENYATKFGQETGHPEFEIDETQTYDNWRKCYQNIDTNNLSREEMIDYIDKNTLRDIKYLNALDDDTLKSDYRSVYNIQLNK